MIPQAIAAIPAIPAIPAVPAAAAAAVLSIVMATAGLFQIVDGIPMLLVCLRRHLWPSKLAAGCDSALVAIYHSSSPPPPPPFFLSVQDHRCVAPNIIYESEAVVVG